MGPLGSSLSSIGVQITDSAYVVANMRIMSRMGTPALKVLGNDGFYVPCMHTVGVPIPKGKEDTTVRAGRASPACQSPLTYEDA